MSRRVRGWRKLAGSTWRAPLDPQFYGDLDLDAGAMLAYIDRVRHATGVRITLTHLVGRAVAHGLSTVPELRIRLARGREYDRESIDVFFIVAAEGGRELTGVKIANVDRKPAVALAEEVIRRCSAIASGTDPELGRGKTLLTTLPPRPLRWALRVGAWLTSDMNLDLSRLGMPRQAFGGAMITSVGSWGIARAYSPLAPYYRVPVLLLIGAVGERPAAVNGEVVVRPMITLTATFDHRYVDGFHAAGLARAVGEYCADPAAFEPPLPEPGQAPDGQPGAGREPGPQPRVEL